MQLHNLVVSSSLAQTPALFTHLGGQIQHLRPSSVRVCSTDSVTKLRGDNAVDTCAEHFSLVVEEDTCVVVKAEVSSYSY